MAEVIVKFDEDNPSGVQFGRISGEIVRRNDCQYLIEFSASDILILLCGRNRGALKEVWAMDYCSWGDRREKENV